MSLHTEIHVPGAFCQDGVHPGIFRPPTTTTPNTASAASSGYLPPHDINPNNHYGSIKRKRNHDRETDPFARSYATATTTRYNIAGQLDTPGGERTDFLGESMFSDADYRRMLGTKLPAGQVEEPVFGRYPLTAPAQPSQSWGAFAVSTLGGVVGRLWQFCRAGSFTGFHAGGGRGYDQDGNTEDDHDMATNGNAQIPEQYTHYNFGEKQEDATDNSRASTPTRPAAKRRQTSATDELGKNWVMVNENGAAVSRAGTPDCNRRATMIPSPRNRNQAPAVATGRRISTPASRRSIGPGRPSLASAPSLGKDRPTSSASYASPRSPSPTKHITADTPLSSSPAKQRLARRNRPSTSGSDSRPAHRRTNSSASIATSRPSKSSLVDSSPRLDPEAKKLAARRQREEQFNDFRVTGLNKTVEDLIRQGQMALATKVEVEGSGWEDED
ncbi:uncharacterized protein F5Z01DRAFT_625185 [Emericellopsis atlantica]|uniref:Uncharacterized protein n=1 Tax=Emericellopsis atlantica TaxID=2614577 RepID=A0A9P7ZJB2_9HYPO|nr:uncharacterized protein F5Z01DRAFT_625185 [Emericellopsis atlantica]KAG9252665.1 hypothetical protein F5Z01DRAFT_625185 [Emericellopsis atlantica]